MNHSNSLMPRKDSIIVNCCVSSLLIFSPFSSYEASIIKKMDFLTAEIVEGKRKNSKLVWIPEEKFLYFLKDTRHDQKIYQCYENRTGSQCPARRTIDSTGKVSMNALPHSHHSSHESIYNDMKTRSNIIDACTQAANVLDGLHVTVPSQQIFTRELAK